jgi:hypothetical protein
MKRIWYIANIGLVAVAWWDGYYSIAPERLLLTNADPIACLALFLVMLLFTLGCVYYSTRRWGQNTLRRPSLHRNPLNWWTDPLQSLFISTCLLAALTIGAALRRPAIGSIGFWMTGVYCSMTIGLVVGQLLVYWIYRHKIIKV